MLCKSNTPPESTSLRRQEFETNAAHSAYHLQELVYGGELGAAFEAGFVGNWSKCCRIVVHKDNSWHAIDPLGLLELLLFIGDISPARIAKVSRVFDLHSSGLVLSLAKGDEARPTGEGTNGRSQGQTGDKLELVISSDKCAE